MKKEYQSPVMEVTELETKEMVLQASDGCPGVSDSPSDTGMGSEANKNIWDRISAQVFSYNVS